MSETTQGVVLPTSPGTVIVLRPQDGVPELFVRRFDGDAKDGYVWLGLTYGDRFKDVTLVHWASKPGADWSVYSEVC